MCKHTQTYINSYAFVDGSFNQKSLSLFLARPHMAVSQLFFCAMIRPQKPRIFIGCLIILPKNKIKTYGV